MTPEQRLAAITALCEQADLNEQYIVNTRAILDIINAPSVGAAQPHDTVRVDLNPLAARIQAHGFDADDTEVICQDVAAWLGLDEEGYLAVVRRGITREQLRGTVGGVLVNVSNYPWEAQVSLWGRDLGPLIDKVTDALAARLEGAAS